jgi:hypothetical protein
MATGINATGDIVGIASTGIGSPAFLPSGGVFTPIDFPLATNTTAFGVTDPREIAGYYNDAAGKLHGFVYADGTFSTVDVAGASGTELLRIKNWGQVTGAYADALGEYHGLIGQ